MCCTSSAGVGKLDSHIHIASVASKMAMFSYPPESPCIWCPGRGSPSEHRLVRKKAPRETEAVQSHRIKRAELSASGTVLKAEKVELVM